MLSHLNVIGNLLCTYSKHYEPISIIYVKRQTANVTVHKLWILFWKSEEHWGGLQGQDLGICHIHGSHSGQKPHALCSLTACHPHRHCIMMVNTSCTSRLPCFAISKDHIVYSSICIWFRLYIRNVIYWISLVFPEHHAKGAVQNVFCIFIPL